MNIGIKNATLISMSEHRDKIEENIDIKIQENKIIEIGQNLNLSDVDKIINANGKIVMPGLINTHSHVPMSIFRETAEGYNLHDWLTKKIWPMEDKMTGEDIYYASYLSFIEMIQTGTTTINDMYFYTNEIIKAAIDSKVRIQITRALMDTGDNKSGEKRFEELKYLLDKYNNYNDCITWNVGIHGLNTTSREYLKKCVNLAREHQLPIHMHFCENTKEIQDIKQLYNQNAIEILEKEFKNIKLILAHAVKLNEDEIKRLSNFNNLSISHCPISNLKLGCGIANIVKMLENNINITIGTDGQGSGSNLDMFESMKYTALLQKGINENVTLLPAYEVLKMATINGAKALGLEDKIGSIEEGKNADIIIIDLNTIVTKPVNNLFSDIVYNVKGNNVQTTIINGNILMENRELKIKSKNVEQKCQEIIARLSNN